MSFLKLNRNLKQRITEDWHAKFGWLGVYRPMWLLRRVGPIALGVCLDRDSSNNCYWPVFHAHCLGHQDSSLSLTLHRPLRTRRTGAADSILAQSHDSHFAEATERLRLQVPLLQDVPITLEALVNTYTSTLKDVHSERYSLRAREDMLTVFAWCGQEARARYMLGEFEDDMRQWPAYIMQKFPGGLDAWVAKCAQLISDPEAIHRCVASETQVHGLGHLPYSELVCP